MLIGAAHYVFCSWLQRFCVVCFFFNDTATTEIYTLSLHDALPIFRSLRRTAKALNQRYDFRAERLFQRPGGDVDRSEEHTSELQSHSDLVCRLLLEKKKKTHETDCLSASLTRAPAPKALPHTRCHC